ncbi:semaphorin-4B-like isoform X2 [Anabas testudineus]|uniref:semaphorin-4B-like isoform X2 n=1 Tax=Anabas testudineus TaxID=64144 RepID=UPI000E4631EB|nr:semaphorin-4B-like isoform X2 [Anabas testudineus]
MAPAAVILLLCLLSAVNSLPPPRTSFLLNSADRPLVHFSLPDVHNTTTLLLSEDGSTLYIGARDAVLSLDVSQSDVISLKKKVVWGPTKNEILSCQNKGKTPEVDCPNFVRVLQRINSTHLYTCGSYAYSPHDAFIDTDSFSMVQHGAAKGRCPFDPLQRNTAITADGELFTATTSDFRGVKPQISRHFSRDGRPDVSQDSSVGLLEEPVFVGSSLDPAEKKLYFFFSEVGKEFSYINELRVARVAQICKDDVGGQRILQKKWTSFAKAPVLCQSPKQLPFNVLQDVFTLQPPAGDDSSETLFYGVFTSQWSSGPESAVCIFTLQDIRTAFGGSYRNFDTQNHQWDLMQGQHSYVGKCGLNNATDAELNQVKKSFLTSSSVNPVANGPVVVSSEQTYSRVAAMRTEAADGKDYTVLFLLSESGFLHKVVLVKGGSWVVEEIQVFTGPQLVKSILLSPSKGVLYVGTSQGVTAVPVATCSVYKTCSQCVLARDPLCGWDATRRVCAGLGSGSGSLAQDLENGNVKEKCQRRARAQLDTELNVRLNEAVNLQCVKPSNLATLTWTSPQFSRNQDKLFIQSADGNLSFFATNATFGTYHCEAEEAGYTEVVASYDVQQISPMRPRTNINERGVSGNDEPYEEITTKEPEIPVKPSDTDDFMTEPESDDNNETAIPTQDSGLSSVQFTDLARIPSAGKSPESRNEPLGEIRKEKSYHSELVVVSLLLVFCICILILCGLHMWRQSKTANKVDSQVSPGTGKKSKSMESVPSLSPEDADPEVKVVQG